MTRRVVLLSVRPRFAERILDGSKTIELRRVRPRVALGDRVLVYVSTPVMALMAAACVGTLLDGTPGELWARVCTGAGVSRTEYNAYFRGATRGVGIGLRNVERLSRAIPLSELRAAWPGFHPPQSFRYLAPEVIAVGPPGLPHMARVGLFQALPGDVAMPEQRDVPPQQGTHRPSRGTRLIEREGSLGSLRCGCCGHPGARPRSLSSGTAPLRRSGVVSAHW